MLYNQEIDKLICRQFETHENAYTDLSIWDKIVNNIEHPLHIVDIAMVGKYVELIESYKSLNEALIHAGIHTKTRVNVHYIDAESLIEEEQGLIKLKAMDAILVPGGFGNRGIEGKIRAIQYARENNIPYLGICLGMQLAVIEYARNVAGFLDANSTEFDKSSTYPIIAMISEWDKGKGVIGRLDENSDLGGTMRLGGFECQLSPHSLAHKIYGSTLITERHRHRYEVNNRLIGELIERGLKTSGISVGREQLVETIELEGHPWFFACQFHPEFTSNPRDGHPLFKSFILAGLQNRMNKLNA
jgi:CTP synthase